MRGIVNKVGVKAKSNIKWLFKPSKNIDLLGNFTRVLSGNVSVTKCERQSDCIFFECDGNGSGTGSEERYLTTNEIDVSGYDVILIHAKHYHANNSWPGGHYNAVILQEGSKITNLTYYSVSSGTSTIMIGLKGIESNIKLGFHSSMVVSIISKIWLYDVALVKFDDQIG